MINKGLAVRGEVNGEQVVFVPVIIRYDKDKQPTESEILKAVRLAIANENDQSFKPKKQNNPKRNIVKTTSVQKQRKRSSKQKDYPKFQKKQDLTKER